jgi:diaminopimelate decarboxylase
MQTWRAGDALASLETPCAIVELDALERNIRRACALAAAASPSATIRPHAKAHKTSAIARLQVELSGGRTVGATCQKLCEVEALLRGGVRDLLLSNQLVNARKIARLRALADEFGDARLAVLVDDADNARALAAAFAGAARPLDVLVEVDVGQRRCGVRDAAAAAALGAVVAALAPALRLRGIQAYHGMSQHVRNVAERRAVSARACALAREARDALLAAGLCCDVVTGAGTGTFWMEAESGVYTELQPGSYLLGDADYARNHLDPAVAEGASASPPAPSPTLCFEAPFPPAFFLLTQVISRRDGGAGERWCVLDSGLKCQSTDSGPGVVVGAVADLVGAGGAFAMPRYDATRGCYEGRFAGLAIASVSDEHSTLKYLVDDGADRALPQVGDALLVLVGHIDPTVNHFDKIVAVRRGVVEAVWDVDARSPGL